MSIRLHSPSVGSGSVSSGDVLVLKVHLSENDAASYKSFKFTAKMKVAEAIDHIKVKTAAASSDKYGLFVNYEEKSGPSAGFWLDPDKTLGHYSLTHKTSIEFKSMVMPISISDLQEDMTKKIKLDLTALVKDVIENICHRFDIDDASEFGLQVRRTTDNMLHWLNMDESFQKQRIDYTQTIVLRKKYFVTDFVVSTKNPSMLHLIFREAHYALINDFYPVTFDQAVQFAALQLQITYGNYDPLLHVANFLDLSKYLPSVHRMQQFVEEDIYVEHRKLKGLAEIDGKFRYLKKIVRLSHFGTTMCPAKEKSHGEDNSEHDIIFGVNYDSILIMQPKTKEIICQNLLVEILAHEIDGKSVTLKFKSKRKEYTFVTVEDSALMIELIHGYKEFHRIRKREKVGGQNFAPSSSPEGLSYLSVKNPIWKSDSFTSKKSMNYPSMMNKLVVKS